MAAGYWRTVASVCAVLCAAFAARAMSACIYVDACAPAGGDGTSWAGAFDTLQEAMAMAVSGDEIRVAMGVYRPDRFVDNSGGTGDRNATFELKSGVKICGGYSGACYPWRSPGYRNVRLYPSILSGDLLGNDAAFDVFDWEEIRSWVEHPTRSENAYTVVTAEGVDGTAVLEGLTITAGHSNIYDCYGEDCPSEPDPNDLYGCRPENNGGGMYIESASPVVIDCTFELNTTLAYVDDTGGGGVCCVDAAPTLRGCRFVNNVVFSGNVSCYGGGMYSVKSAPVLAHCLFEGNIVTGFDDEYYGGGMYNRASSAILRDCLFLGNQSIYSSGAGGLVNDGSSDVLVERCEFRENVSNGLTHAGNGRIRDCRFDGNYGSGLVVYGSPLVTGCVFSANRGSGVYHSWQGAPQIRHCLFINNTASEGAGLYNWYGSLSLEYCRFSGNVAAAGGAIHCSSGQGMEMEHCLFDGNVAYGAEPWEGGGAIHSVGDSLGGYMAINHCTFAGNVSPTGRALVCWSWQGQHPSDITIVNSVLWDGGSEIANRDWSGILVAFSDVQGGAASCDDPYNTIVWGTGNIDLDPAFARAGGREDPGTPEDWTDDGWLEGDYHLKSEGGRWDGEQEAWVRDEVTSPCVDAGDPGDAIMLEPLPNGGVVNMGVYGGTAEASKSSFGAAVCGVVVTGDLNGDCVVNLADVALMAIHWLEDRR